MRDAPTHFPRARAGHSRVVRVLMGIGALGVLGACGRAHDLDDAALRDADADSAQWLSYGRTYSEQRHSPLRQIDEASVGRLGLAWTVDMQTLRGLEATPLVSDGVLYVTSAWSVVYAIDARDGKVLWRHDPAVPKDHAKFVCCDVVNRGVALYRDKVYVGTIDGRLVALDRKTGTVVWSVQTTPKNGPYAITGAPRIAGGKVVIGNAGSEYAVRGFLSAYDAGTGAMAWKTYMVPGDPSKPFEQEALRRAAATWSGRWYEAGGGGSPWDPIVYDPALDLIYVGTANANPWYPELRGDKEGDNLYASSIVAIRGSTGEIVWHYQTTPGDSWDYDATQPITLADLTIDGRPRKVLMQPNKNAFLYVIDRENGKLISATPYASMTWATGIDSSGRPIVNPAAKPSAAGVLVSPADYGAHNWNPTSFSPTTGFLYLSVTDGGVLLHVVDPKFELNPNDRTMGIDPRYAGPLRAKRDSMAPLAKGRLVAWNPVTMREAWRVEHPGLRSGGTLSTAGNLVFQGRGDGIFAAYRATDGRMLWQFDAQVGIAAAPMTYAIDGVQYVAILAAPPGYYLDPKIRTGPGRLLVFALDGKAALAPNPVRVALPIAPPTFAVKATPAEITEGGGLWFQYCRRCHNPDFNFVKSGAIPDLRRANEATHATFEQIVRSARSLAACRRSASRTSGSAACSA